MMFTDREQGVPMHEVNKGQPCNKCGNRAIEYGFAVSEYLAELIVPKSASIPPYPFLLCQFRDAESCCR